MDMLLIYKNIVQLFIISLHQKYVQNLIFHLTISSAYASYYNNINEYFSHTCLFSRNRMINYDGMKVLRWNKQFIRISDEIVLLALIAYHLKMGKLIKASVI